MLWTLKIDQKLFYFSYFSAVFLSSFGLAATPCFSNLLSHGKRLGEVKIEMNSNHDLQGFNIPGGDLGTADMSV